MRCSKTIHPDESIPPKIAHAGIRPGAWFYRSSTQHFQLLLWSKKETLSQNELSIWVDWHTNYLIGWKQLFDIPGHSPQYRFANAKSRWLMRKKSFVPGYFLKCQNWSWFFLCLPWQNKKLYVTFTLLLHGI
jgi:hypothetical protein